MRILCVGDLHFREDNAATMDAVVYKIQELILKTQPAIVVLLGDILNDHERMNVFVFNRAVRFILNIASYEFIKGVFVLMGNHDLANPSSFMTEDHAFMSLKGREAEGIFIVDTARSTDVQTEDKRYRLVFVPYVQAGRFHEALDGLTPKISQDPPVCIFAHQEFKGCKIGDGIVSRTGDVWPEENPLVMTGHMHTSHWVGQNIFYVGMPYQNSVSDQTTKGIAFLDISGETPTLKFLKLDIRRRKRVDLKVGQLDSFVPDPREETLICVSGTSDEIRAFKMSGKADKWRGDSRVKLQVKLVDDDSPLPQKQMTFRERIQSALKSDSSALQIFESLFQKERKEEKQLSLQELLDMVSMSGKSPTPKRQETPDKEEDVPVPMEPRAVAKATTMTLLGLVTKTDG